MIHLSKFQAAKYRGIDGLVVPHLTQANLVTGANGAGKTALLEAIWLFAGRNNPSQLWNANVLRTVLPVVDPISRLADGKLNLQGEKDGKHRWVEFVFEKINGTAANIRGVRGSQEDLANLPPVVGILRTFLDGKLTTDGPSLHLTPSGVVLYGSSGEPARRPSCVFDITRFQNEVPAEYLRRYSDLVREGRKSELVDAIGVIVEGLEGVELLTDEGGEPYLSVVLNQGMTRLIYDLGGGAVRLVRLLLGSSAARNGILLSDELENGIHFRVQREVWGMAREWMTHWNVQFVATTHSGELIDAAIDAFADDAAEELSVHHLFRNEDSGQVEIARFSGDSLLGARDLILEVR